jgi:glycosyltransferase involved in cell wall biosynthesis
MVTLEAHASGLPVIAADSPAARELVRHGVDGLRYDPATPGSLTDAVKRLHADPALRAAMAREARRSVNGASWTRATEALRRCYDAACNARPGARTARPAPPLTPDGDGPDTTARRQVSA